MTLLPLDYGRALGKVVEMAQQSGNVKHWHITLRRAGREPFVCDVVRPSLYGAFGEALHFYVVEDRTHTLDDITAFEGELRAERT